MAFMIITPGETVDYSSNSSSYSPATAGTYL